MTTQPTQTWRDTFISICPRWLLGKNGYALITVLGLMFDLLATALDFGIRSKFPGVNHGMTSLIGRQRGIKRGPNEDDTTYERRLRYWRQIRRRVGNPYALLEQVQIFFYPVPVHTRLIAHNGTRYTLAPGGWQYTLAGFDPNTAPAGTVVTDQVTWAWGTPAVGDFWVLVWVDGGAWPSGVTYANDLTFSNAGTVDDGGTIGSTASPSDVSGLVETVRLMTPPHANARNIVLAFSESDFNGISPASGWTNPGERSPDFEYINA